MPAAPPPNSATPMKPRPPAPVQAPSRAIPHTWDSWSERKKTTMVAVVFFGVLGVLLAAVLIAAYVGYHPTAAQRADAHNEAIADPQSIEGPDYGQRPTSSGDPGGWEQLALGSVLVVGLPVGGLLVIRSGRRTRQRRLTDAQGTPS